MNINHGNMDLYFSYNRQVGNVSVMEKAVSRFSDLAKNAQNAETRERYAQAVSDLQKRLPEAKKELNNMGKSMGLDEGKIGRPISLEEIKKDKTRFTYDQAGSISSYIEDPTGEYLSTKS